MPRSVLISAIFMLIALLSFALAALLQQPYIGLAGLGAMLVSFYVWEKNNGGEEHHPHDLVTFEPKYTPEEARVLGLQVVHPSAIVNPAMKQVAAMAAYEQVKLVDTLVRLMPDVYSDPVIASEVLSAFLARAIQVSDPGEEVIVHTEEGKDDLLFTVEDKGPGFDEAAWKEMQLGSWPFPGMPEGIPFSEITTRIEKLQGVLEVESEPGKGASFTLVLPKANELED